jgi:hypothetical protein
VPPPDPRIRAGVSSAGVDLSGLTVAEAAAELDAAIAPRLAATLRLGVAGRPWTLDPVKDAKLDLDAERTAKRALYAKAGVTEVPARITFRRAATRDFVEGVAAKVARAPRPATVRISRTRVTIKGGKRGHRLDVKATRRLVDAALADVAAPRVLHKRLTKISSPVTYKSLRRQYGTVITIDRATFTLRLFKDLKVRKRYGVAVGAPGYTTPAGLFAIQSKQVNPAWTAPNSPWAGELAGTTTAGGSPSNPLKARWMGVNGAVGIHGTGQEGSIGTRASHGCIRMRVAEVIDLFDRVRIGTPVKIF